MVVAILSVDFCNVVKWRYSTRHIDERPKTMGFYQTLSKYTITLSSFCL